LFHLFTRGTVWPENRLPAFFFGRNKYNIYLLPSTEPLKCPMKPTPKDEVCTYIKRSKSRGELVIIYSANALVVWMSDGSFASKQI